MHRDVVARHPEGTLPLAATHMCAVQGMYIPKRMIAVQGHPEFTGEIMAEIVEMRHDLKLFTDDMYESALARANKDHDGVLIAQAFLRFLRE
jgi:GMP synthase-like glutamine amidotransferase